MENNTSRLTNYGRYSVCSNQREAVRTFRMSVCHQDIWGMLRPTRTHIKHTHTQINSLTDSLFLSTTPPLSFLSSTCLCRSAWKRRDAEVVITDDADAKGQLVAMHMFPAHKNVTDISHPLKFFWTHCVVTHQGYREPERVCCGGVSPLFNPCHRPSQHHKMVRLPLSLMHVFCLVLSATVLHSVFFFFFCQVF